MQCSTCKHWEAKKYHGPVAITWGTCKHLASGAADIDFYTNNREGEWVETIVETLPDWYCKEWDKKEEDDAIQKG